MNILVISNAAWDDKNSSGNTYSNLLGDWSNVTFHSMYSREQLPDNNCCSTYCCVSPFNLIKNIFTPWRIGRIFTQSEINRQNISAISEQAAKNNIIGLKRLVVLTIIDLLYLSGFWLNKKIRKYISDCNPDIVLMTCISEAFRYRIIKYIKSNTKAKLITYIVDDAYHTEKTSGTFLGWMRSKKYKTIFELSDNVYGISQEMCDAYSKEFGCHVSLLHKGCELNEPMQSVNNPIEIVYAGNLLYGRDDILGKLADALVKINKEELKVVLKIYTGTHITDAISDKLNKGESSKIIGPKPYEEIKEMMRHADIVLHVESFDPNQMKVVRYSFSTKITDCLQSGAVMMAIGPKGIASIEYPKRIPGAIVVDNLNNLEDSLRKVIENPSELLNRAKISNDYAREHFEISAVRNKLKNDFEELLNK